MNWEEARSTIADFDPTHPANGVLDFFRALPPPYVTPQGEDTFVLHWTLWPYFVSVAVDYSDVFVYTLYDNIPYEGTGMDQLTRAYECIEEMVAIGNS